MANKYAVIDIGTCKVTLLALEGDGHGKMSIIHYLTKPSEGMRKGGIVNYDQVARVVHALIEECEKKIGGHFKGAFLSVGAGSLSCEACMGVCQISGADRLVSEEDIAHACDSAKRIKPPSGNVELNFMRNGFLLDGRQVDNPLNLQGKVLEARMLLVYASESAVADMIRLVRQFQVEVLEVTGPGVADSYALPESDRASGCLVINVGAGTTDFALSHGGAVVRCGSIPVGGDHITNDIATGLSMNEEKAEEFKLRIGKAILEESDKGQSVMLYGDLALGDRMISKQALVTIANARVTEIFELVRQELGEAYSPLKLGGGIVLTGGTARLAKIVECAQGVFETSHVRVYTGLPGVAEELCAVDMSTALGLARYVSEVRPDLAKSRPPKRAKVPVIGDLFGKFMGRDDE